MWVKDDQALRRLREVIRTDATTTSKSDFMITHAPFETLYLNGQIKITEDELLEKYLLSPDHMNSHKLIMVQGGNGSGKTHLIRWLKEKYEAATDRNEEAVLLISRAHNNLQDAMTQLLESGIFPEEVKTRTLNLLKNARGSLSIEDFKKTINYNFVLEIQNDTASTSVDQRTRDRLVRYLLNPYILDTFLMVEGGPLDRMRSRIETTDESHVADGDAPVFLPDDFAITVSQINTGLKRKDDHADSKTIQMAEDLCVIGSGIRKRETIASYLNTKVSAVIRRSMDLKSVDFQHIFEELRKDLKRKGMALTLFLEDINAFTGIDEALMEALLVDHRAEGNQECCRLTSVVGSTIWFYENKLNSSIRERITNNVYLREGSVIAEHHLDSFAARYINAINLPSDKVELWYKNGANSEDIPLAQLNYPFSEVVIQGNTYSIFPFTATALDRLYDTLEIRDENNSSRTPRVVLNQILQQILTQWYEHGPGIFASENNFINQSFSIPRWADDTYEISNRNLSEDFIVERSILLRIWGDGTTNRENDTIGGVSKEIFEAFGIPFPDAALPPIITPDPKPIIVTPPPPSPPKDDRLQKAIAEINDWAANPDTFLRSHPDLRDDLVRFIMNNLPWCEWDIPFKLAEACVQRRFFIIEGQSAAMQTDQNCFTLPRNEESRYLLHALARWRYAGGNSWEFEHGLDYYTIAISWLEKHAAEICHYVVHTKNSNTAEELAELGVLAQYCAKIFADGFQYNMASEDAAIALFKTAPEVETHTTQIEKWNTLCSEIASIPEQYQLSLSFFRKAVGARKAEEANYMFVDAYKLLNIVDKLCASNWNLDSYALNSESLGIRTTFSVIINKVKEEKSEILSEARHEANAYKSYFAREISEDCTKKDINDTIHAMVAFLSYLSKNNLNYDSILANSIKENRLASETYQSLELMKKMLSCQDNAQLLSMLSFNPFLNIVSINKTFTDFDRLVREKDQLFMSGINQALQNEVDESIRKTKDELKIMQTQCEQLKKVQHNG